MADDDEEITFKPLSAPVGRPSSYDPSYPEQAKKLCMLGATDMEMAEFFDISVSTFYKWKNEYQKFSEAVSIGKEHADNRVERSLYQRAIGYRHEAVKIFMPAGASEPVYAKYIEQLPPDGNAAAFWLKNRRPTVWRDVQKHELGRPGEFSEMPDDKVLEMYEAIRQANPAVAAIPRPSRKVKRPDGTAH